MPPNHNTDDAEQRWRALAEEALKQAEVMTDTTARLIMLKIAKGYQRLAERAKLKRDAGNSN